MTCNKCMLSEANCLHHPCVMGVGPSPARVMLIGEAPGVREDWLGEPFVGSAGDLLSRVLTALGVQRSDVFLTNVIRCRPPNNKLPCKSKLMPCWEACKPHLEAEIRKVNPKVVVLMGTTPLALVKGLHPITKYEGMKLGPDVLGHKCMVFASFHPAYILRAASKEARLASALAQAFIAAGMTIDVGGIVDGRPMYTYDVKE